MYILAQIDLTKLGNLLRENPDLTKKIQFKDGEHQLLSVIIGEKRETDKAGNNLNITCKPKGVPYDSKWYIGDGKTQTETAQPAPSAPNPATPNTTASPSPFVTPPSGDSGDADLPF